MWHKDNQLRSKLAEVREREGQAVDHCAEMYRRPGHQERMRRVEEVLREQAPGRDFLDIGCAEGTYCGLALRYGAVRVVGLDISPTKIMTARGRYPTCAFEVADIMELGRWKESFALVLCSEVLQHVPDYLEAAASVFACVQPGGLAVITAPNLSLDPGHIMAELNGSMTVEELLKEVGGAGFGRQNALWKFNTGLLFQELAGLPKVRKEAVIEVDTPDGKRKNLWTIGLFRMS